MTDFPRQFIDIDPVDPTKVYRYKELDLAGNWTGTYRYFQYDPGELNSTPTSLNRAWMQPMENAIDDLYAKVPTISFVDYYNVEGSIRGDSVTSLNYPRGVIATAKVGNYALFGGGHYYNSGERVTADVDAYNASLVHTTATTLSVSRKRLSAASVGNYAVFAGGCDNVYNCLTTVDAYNESLVLSTPTALSAGRYDLKGASVGDYAVFAGGYTTAVSNIIDVYSTSLARTTPITLAAARTQFTATSIGGYALFGGGSGNSGHLSSVETVNSSLVLGSTASGLTTAKYDLASAATSYYAMFAGGYDGITYYPSAVDAYNSSLVKTSTANITGRYKLGAAATQERVYFAGGYTSSNSLIVQSVDNSLVMQSCPQLAFDGENVSGINIGDYVLFGGFVNSYGQEGAGVNSYKYQYSSSIDIPPWYNYKFHNHATEQFTRDGTTLEYTVKATGYIKPAVKRLTGYDA